MPDLSFAGRVVVVTGAGRGIGRAHALLLARRGASVVVNDLGVNLDGTGPSAEPAEDTALAITQAGGRAAVSTADVTTPEGVASIVELSLSAFGGIHGLINNAGIAMSAGFADTDEADLQRLVDVHLIGAFRLSRACWPHLARCGSGRIVNTVSSTIFGFEAFSGYSAAKGGVFSLTRAMAREGRELGIKVNNLMPTANTRMHSVATQPREVTTWTESASKPADSAAATAALLVHESCPCTGETLGASGGHITRIFLAETQGYAGSDPTIEDIMANFETVMAPDCAELHTCTMDRIENSMRLDADRDRNRP